MQNRFPSEDRQEAQALSKCVINFARGTYDQIEDIFCL
jgi:hypothetical protein